MKKINLIMGLGIALFVTSCSESTNTNNPKVAVGDQHQGGIVFYVDQNGEHGLIAAPSDQSTSVKWQVTVNTTTSANGSGIGSGQANTTAIIAAYGSGNYAAQICNDLVLGGYDDWYLPSKDELTLMRTKKTTIGGFTTNSYWSSTESSSYDAWAVSFGTSMNPSTYSWGKESNMRVRAIRSF